MPQAVTTPAGSSPIRHSVPGPDDREIADVAERERRLLVTYDGDFIEAYGTVGHVGIIFGQDDRMTPHRAARIVDAMVEHVEQEQIVAHDEPFYLTPNWL